MTSRQAFVKRMFDITLAVLGLLAVGWLILICWLLASVDTRRNGFYAQDRVGRYGKTFRILKIRTMRPVPGISTVVTTVNDPRITPLGAALRRWKLDELPQLLNVLVGDMSFVGPRPDTREYAEMLQGAGRAILSVRPGITGPASLAYIDEEELLARVDDPEQYNKEVLFPAKVLINISYVEHYSFYKDLLYVLATLVPGMRDVALGNTGVSHTA